MGDSNVIYVRGNIDWELLEDGSEPPLDLPLSIALTVVLDEDGAVEDIIDEDLG